MAHRLFRLTASLLGLAALGLVGCGEDTPEDLLRKSCEGEAVPNCLPYEYAIVREGMVEPAEVEIGDPLASLRVTVRYDRCDMAPGPHSIGIQGIVETGGDTRDGGMPGSQFLLGTVRDDDEDGVIETMVPNFFINPVPPNRTLTLRFIPRLGMACSGAHADSEYRTGDVWSAGP